MGNKDKLFLVDFDTQTFKEIGELDLKELDDLLPVCQRYKKDLKEDKWIYIAAYQPVQEGYLARYRATYAEYMLTEPEYEDRKESPFYIDVAEHSERCLFDEVVNRDKGIFWSDELQKKYGES